ncbi:MAG: hypothetical protein JWO05_2852 [Gemmatimonadetes bacterium]|nr:hypothetical protein [Gemmatimonadota bacterium]
MSRGARWFLACVILLLMWMTLAGWDSDSTKARVWSVAIAGFMGLIVIGLLAPKRALLAFRLTAGLVALGYLGYFISEVVQLLRGDQQQLRVGRPSALMAGLGLLVYGVPALIFALGAKRVGLARLFGAGNAADTEHRDGREPDAHFSMAPPPRPDEVELYMPGDPATALRIATLISTHLREIGRSEDGWTSLYEDPGDARLWELSYPQSSSHGGGPPRLAVVTAAEAAHRYPDRTS